MSPETTLDRRRRRRDQLLEAADACFAARGYHATTVDEIVSRAGLSKGTLYLYFASKEELFFALLERWLDRVVHFEPVSPAHPALAQLAGLVRSLCDGVAADAQRAALELRTTTEFWAEAARNPAVAARLRQLYGGHTVALANLIEGGITTGEFAPDLDPAATAAAVIALVDGLLLRAMLGGEGFDWAAARDASIRLIAGLAASETR